MNFRLKALKEMKEEILLKKSKIANEVNDKDVNCFVPVLYYNHNSIYRDILEKPIEIYVKPDVAE